MVSFFHYLKKLETKICEPDPSLFPDRDLRKDLYLKNSGQLRANINFLIVYGVISLLFNLQASAHLFWLGFVSLHVTSLICFCRRRLWVCYWIYTLSVTFGQLVFILLIRDSLIYALILSFLTPLCVLSVTRSLTHVAINFIGQLVLLHVKYKFILQEVLTEMDPAEFSGKFSTAASLVLIAMTIAYSLMFKTFQETQMQLKVSKVEAESACSQLKLFLQTFSHELRNPLNSLLGNLQLALQEALPPKVHETVETAKVCADILLQLINNILDIGKAQAGKLDISMSPVRMTDYVGGVWRITKDLIKRKKLGGGLKVDRQMPSMLSIDSYRINQVLLNLLSNAIKFTDKGQIWISFHWIADSMLSEKCFAPYPYDDDGLFEKNNNFKTISRSQDESDSIVYLESNFNVVKNIQLKRSLQKSEGVLKIIVRDTGVGIKPDDLTMLFTKFSQVGTDLAKRKVGTGLGLYITKQICEAMGGEIRVYSKENVGTTFIVCIPTSTADISEEVTNISQAISYLKYLKPQLLLVDDNIFNLDLLKSYAAKIEGDVVETAQNGMGGYNKYQELIKTRKRADFIFLDIDMPIMNGKIMCQKIRNYESVANIKPSKIIFVTGNSEESEMKELLDKKGVYRGDAFIKKPLSFELFINTIEKLAR